MYTNILIPTDGSELSAKAIQHGVALAKRIGARVTALTALPPYRLLTTDIPMLGDTPDQYQARMREQSAMLDRLTHHCDIVETGNTSWRFKNRN
jgi:nucleotide-binding universal stress UspA family protein